MPPQLPYSIIPPLLAAAPTSPLLPLNLTTSRKQTQTMNATSKKLIPTLVFILTAISILRLLRITVTTSSSPPAAMPLPLIKHKHSFTTTQLLTEKEYKFLSHLISHRAPCNLLVFGLHQQYLGLVSSCNAGGITVFLENDPGKLTTFNTNSTSTRVYKVQYETFAKDAYKLLKHARKNPGCSSNSGKHKVPKCKLALTKLPKEVYAINWDVVVVDGPSGEGPDAPGRMATIYTASVLARREKNMTNVVVHDVDRMIEKWFSWEFLCDDNLVSSKGRFWNFGIARKPNSTTFCTA